MKYNVKTYYLPKKMKKKNLPFRKGKGRWKGTKTTLLGSLLSFILIMGVVGLIDSYSSLTK